ncbi:MAG: DUF4380 domain-containing protein [Melioribacteraceae bacterium]|nr:DUF4380 domain-containing protein [Melioribacteraceae bacterium]
MKYLIILALIISACTMKNENSPNEGNIITLSNGKIEAKVLLNGGGGLVTFSNFKSENVLLSDESLWNNDLLTNTDKYDEPKFYPFSGHINWVGPQSEWWTQQNEFPKLKEQKSVWPPDPYLVLGDYKLLNKTETLVKLISPKSKYSGVQFTKEYIINDDSSLDLILEMENIRDTEVSWDIWFNTRMNGFCKVYVPIATESDLRLEYRNGAGQEPINHIIENGFFSFIPEKPAHGKTEKVAKSFIYPNENRIYAFTENEMLVIEFDRYNRELTHPEQGMIEIFNSIRDTGDALLELEYHSPYYKLESGESKLSKERWYLDKYNGSNSMEDHIAKINSWEINFNK